MHAPAPQTSTHRWLRIAVLVLVTASFLSIQGCTWFKKKKTAPAPTPDVPVATTPTTPPPAPVATDDTRKEINQLLPFTELQTIYFDFDKATIRGDQMQNVENNAKYLVDHPADKVYIEGHCDERGTTEYNYALGYKRATAVRDYYVKKGVAADRIVVVSKGEEAPEDPGKGEAAYSKNRRAAFMKMQ